MILTVNINKLNLINNRFFEKESGLTHTSISMNNDKTVDNKQLKNCEFKKNFDKEMFSS